MELCFSTLGCAERSLPAILSLANESGIKKIELRGTDDVIDNRINPRFLKENQAHTLSLFKKAGVCAHVLDASCQLHRADLYQESIAEAEATISIASALGIPYVRIFGDKITEDQTACLDRILLGTRRLCEFAEDKNVTVLFESHGDFNCEKNLAPVVRALCDKRNFGIIWDVGKTHQVYPQNPLAFYEAFKDVILHVHIKDVIGTVDDEPIVPGKGDVDILSILKRLKDDGFKGAVSLEWERRWHPWVEPIEIPLAAFCRLYRSF